MAIDPNELEAEANADFERLMNPAPATQDTPQSQPAEPVTPPVADNQPPAPPAPKPAADTGEGNLEERYKNLRADHTRKAQENADLKRQLDQMQQQLNQSSQSQQPPAPTQKAAEPDELDNAAKDFEELSPLVKKLKAQDEVIRDLTASRQQQSQQDYYGRIAAKHPDHAQVYQSPEFQGWMTRLSGLDKRAADMAFQSGAAEDVIEVFDRYKQSIGMGNKQEQAAQLAEPTLRSRSQPQTQSSRARFTWQQIEKMSNAEFSENEEAINQAIANGEVV